MSDTNFLEEIFVVSGVGACVRYDKSSKIPRPNSYDLFSRAELLDITQGSWIVVPDNADRDDTHLAKSSRSSDSMDIQISIVKQVVVDHERHLLRIDTGMRRSRVDRGDGRGGHVQGEELG